MMFLLWKDYVIDYEIQQELVGIFSTKEKAEDVIKFFDIKENIRIEKYDYIDRFDFIDFSKKSYFLILSNGEISINKNLEVSCFIPDKIYYISRNSLKPDEPDRYPVVKYFYTMANSEEEAINKFKELLK